MFNKQIEVIKNTTKSYLKPITGIINLFKFISSDKLNNLLKLADVIEDVKVNEDNDVMIEFKNSFIIKSNGHQIYYTKEGRIISSASIVSDNPNFKVTEYVDRLDIKSLAEKDHKLYVFYMTKYIDFSNFTFREKRN